MGQVRFDTVRDLFHAYPMARHDVGKAEADKPSLDFLQEAADARNWHGGRVFLRLSAAPARCGCMGMPLVCD